MGKLKSYILVSMLILATLSESRVERKHLGGLEIGIGVGIDIGVGVGGSGPGVGAKSGTSLSSSSSSSSGGGGGAGAAMAEVGAVEGRRREVVMVKERDMDGVMVHACYVLLHSSLMVTEKS